MDLFSVQGGPIIGAPPTESKGLIDFAPAPRFDSDFNDTIDRVLSVKSKTQNPDQIALARAWLCDYYRKTRHQPNAHPPDDKLVAVFLAIAPWPRLAALLQELFRERIQAGDNYAWFVTVAFERLLGVKPDVLRARREQLKLVRRDKGETPDKSWSQGLLDDLVRAAGGKP